MTVRRLSVCGLLLLIACVCAQAQVSRPGPGAESAIWTVYAIDSKGDGRLSSALDAAQLSCRYDKQRDLLWFRVALYGNADEEAFDVTLALNTGSVDSAKTNWWGANKEFKFDRLVTAQLTRVNGAYKGTIGVADAAGAEGRKFDNLMRNNLQLRIDGDAIVIGVKRSDLTQSMKMDVIAAIGSHQSWTDEIPNARFVSLDLAAPRPTRGLREIDVNRNNFVFPSNHKTLAEHQPPRITKKGTGPEALILIPGVYSGGGVFDGFIARNASTHSFYIVTPPGLNGTPARPLPPESVGFGEFTWMRRLERDILELIKKEQLRRPAIVAHGFPGSLVAEGLAIRNPEAVGGVIEIAAMPLQPFPSPKDPKASVTPAERIQLVNEGWGAKWFKYVTPETWESNNYPAAMFANDPVRAEQVRRQIETNPLPVKIRYLCEYQASDHREGMAKVDVPFLVLRPAFDEKVLAEPAHGWFKTLFHDSWNAIPRTFRIELMTIPDARALILDDQPKLADDAIASFLRRVAAERKQ